ncbi:hypothetical protein V2J91_10750 [Pseudomonas alliivorans]|nr:hypothetical protein [Pseudomonas alliivorans]MEE5146561.1 hypothetical protein [Pseudomonas alliivorans]
MSASALKPRHNDCLKLPKKLLQEEHLPIEVTRAQRVNWGVFVDAFLMNAAKVGNRFAAEAYGDQSGLISDGTTVATAPVRSIASVNGFQLLQTLDAGDHYVIVTELKS